MKDFKKYAIIPASPKEIYLAITIELTATLWTGEGAEIDGQVGGKFSMWDGTISGEFLELTPFKKIVQEWYFGDSSENPSMVTIKLHEHKKGCSMEITQTNIPDEEYENISEGWADVYIASLIEFYQEE